MQTEQVTTFTAFRFAGFANRFWAFSQMGLAPARLRNIAGLQFNKLVGSGAANGFSIRPNLGLYGMLQVWESEQYALDFLAKHPVYQDYKQHSTAAQTVFLRNTMAHGVWDGKSPFLAAQPFDPGAPVAVLTRATIRTRHMLRFWRDVPQVSRDVEDKPGLLFAVGIGELPLIQQATFSLWQSGREMLDFAYRRQEHSAVIQKTRALGWYKEELFARFVPYRSVGAGIWDLGKMPD
jgi:hypothetical protein